MSYTLNRVHLSYMLNRVYLSYMLTRESYMLKMLSYMQQNQHKCKIQET